MVMEHLIKCGVRVYGGNGNGTLISAAKMSDLLLEYFSGFFLSSSCSHCALFEIVVQILLFEQLESLCLMMKRKDGLGRRGWYPLDRHVLIS